MADTPERHVPVDILGQRYTIRSGLDERYVAELAAYVDEKMRAAAGASSVTDPLRVAVIAALNIADELFRSREADRSWQQDLRDRTAEIERLVDEVLTA